MNQKIDMEHNQEEKESTSSLQLTVVRAVILVLFGILVLILLALIAFTILSVAAISVGPM